MKMNSYLEKNQEAFEYGQPMIQIYKGSMYTVQLYPLRKSNLILMLSTSINQHTLNIY